MTATTLERGQEPPGTHLALAPLSNYELLVYAETLDDLERTRIATENRVRAMTDEGIPTQLQGIRDDLTAMEHKAVLTLQKAVKRNPFGPWIENTKGIGLKQGGRLLAAIGDPYWNDAENRPRRGPSELWAYCGYHVVEGQRPKRRKGVQANWNGTAKMRARLCAESCIKKADSPYRAVYDEARASWADRETSDLHKHNHALACVAKAILKDLFLEAKRLHG